jgi:uncharacterized protein YodC (DUF2158 family)
MKQDNDWLTVSTSYDPLALYRLIEKTTLAQTEDQYPFATVYAQELAFYSLKQDSLTNPQWYERFNTKVDVGAAIGVTHQHKVLLEYVAMELHQQAFATLGAAEQQAVRDDAEERYILFAFLFQSGQHHAKLKEGLKDDFTKGNNRYPKNRQQTLHLLDNYSKTATPKMTPSEGSSFVQKGGKGRGIGKGKRKPFDKEKWKDRECNKCKETGHPGWSCPNDDANGDAKSQMSQASSMKKLERALTKSIKKSFTQLQKTNESDSDISASDELQEESHFQFEVGGFQFAQVENEFEPQIAKLFKQVWRNTKNVRNDVNLAQALGTKTQLDLREVILLDSQSTMDLFCNRALVKRTFRSDKSTRLKSNGGTMVVTKKAKMAGYHTDVWYDKHAITNILALSNVIKQYRVTYDSDEQMFVVHWESANKPNMEFLMHESGLHYYDPRNTKTVRNEANLGCDKNFIFVETVSGNKQQGFTQRQIKGAEAAQALYAMLSYPSWKDFKWVIRSNQIKDCPVTVQDVDIAHTIWGKNIAALKGKNTRSKPAPVARDFVKVPVELMNLHRKVFLTVDIFFINKIPFFLTLSRRICFTAVNHLADRTVPQIFKAFKEQPIPVLSPMRLPHHNGACGWGV